MKTRDLKDKIVSKIKSSKDEHLLNEVYRLIQLESEISEEVYVLSNEQKTVIKEGIQQLDKGQYLTNEQANAQIEEWLKKSDGQ